MKKRIFWLFAGICAAISAQAQVIESDKGVYRPSDFKSVAAPFLKAGNTEHLILTVTKSEVPHTHEEYDLLVFLQRGEAALHVPAGVFEMHAGDASVIKRGDEHWAELLSDDAIIYIVKIFPDSGN